MNLFEKENYIPLAEKMRPQKFSDLVGQEEILNFLENTRYW